MNNDYPKYYRHFKGGKYKALMEGKDSETQEAVVIYQALYGEHGVWVRPKKMFYENVEREDYSGPRFTEISEEEALEIQPKEIRLMRANQLPEQAAAYYVRIQGMARQHHILLREEFDEHDNPNTQYIVAMDDVLPVATCRMYKLDEEHIMLGRIVVLPEYRHQGLGTRVVREAETWACEQGYKVAVLDSREEKQDFYARMGYVANPEIITEGTFRCIRMEKKIGK